MVPDVEGDGDMMEGAMRSRQAEGRQKLEPLFVCTVHNPARVSRCEAQSELQKVAVAGEWQGSFCSSTVVVMSPGMAVVDYL